MFDSCSQFTRNLIALACVAIFYVSTLYTSLVLIWSFERPTAPPEAPEYPELLIIPPPLPEDPPETQTEQAVWALEHCRYISPPALLS